METGEVGGGEAPGRRRWSRVVLVVLGPVIAGLVAWALPESYAGASGAVESVTGAARAAAGLGAWMALWWITETVDPSVTALLPIAVLPLFGGTKVAAVCAPYAHPLVFLFLGGFLLSIALQRWELHRRFALAVVGVAGTSPSRLVLGFMVATALLSMWVSNTATVVVMLPIALSVLSLVEAETQAGSSAAAANFPTALLLGVAYAGSIGGMATLVGSPPNLIAASTLQEMGIEVDFLGWLSVGLPASVLFLPIAWWWLTRRLFPVERVPIEGAAGRIAEARAGLGPMGAGGRRTLAIFGVTALAWIARPALTRVTLAGAHPLAGLTDTGIAIAAALLLFVTPAGRREGRPLLTWREARALPWGTLLLFGGGLSLARALGASGVTGLLGSLVGGLSGLPALVIVGGVVTLVIFLTELTSNTATTATLAPLLAALAGGLGLSPSHLVIPAALSASCAFMLPVATPPNAIVFGTGRIPARAMLRAGLVLNLVGIVLLTLLFAWRIGVG